MHNVGQALSGQVSIGFAPGTAASSITMPYYRRFALNFRRSFIYLHENSGAVLNEKLINHQLDMAVIYEHSPVAGVSSQALLKEDLFLVGTQDCPGKALM
ncbi:Nitrogen assimilation regulatory protein nac [Escherichia coli]|nr:Nitrogen assimilation regulatory protein nac [Escherichia coli]